MSDLSITNYASLLTTLAAYAARDDLTSQGFWQLAVQLTEAKFNRILQCHDMEGRATASIDTLSSEPEFVSLPSDYQSMRRVRLSGVTGKPRLFFLTSESMDEKRFSAQNAPGQPRYFTILGEEMELFPTPDSAYTLEMTYRKIIPPLSANSTNWLLSTHPDAYLYGALMEAEPYMKNDQRITTWLAGLKLVTDQINSVSDLAVFNAGPLQMQVGGQAIF